MDHLWTPCGISRDAGYAAVDTVSSSQYDRIMGYGAALGCANRLPPTAGLRGSSVQGIVDAGRVGSARTVDFCGASGRMLRMGVTIRPKATPAQEQAKIQKVRELSRELDRLEGERNRLNSKIKGLVDEMGALMRGEPLTTGRTSAAAGSDPALFVEVFDKHEDASKADKALKLVGDHPGISTADLATSLYGKTDVKSRNRARSVMYFLKTKGKARPRPEGGWELGKAEGPDEEDLDPSS